MELKVQVININAGKNIELKENCPVLKEYMIYVEKVRQYAAQTELSAAVERAVDECIREGVLKEFLLKQRSEVIMVSIYEYDEEKEMKLIRADERKIGIEQGESKLAQLMSRLFVDGRADDAQRAASDENDRKALYKEYGFF